MKYWFLKLDVTAGEYECPTVSVHKGDDFDANEYAQDYWPDDGDGGEGEDGSYDFDCGCVNVTVSRCDEITKKEYDVLSKFI